MCIPENLSFELIQAKAAFIEAQAHYEITSARKREAENRWWAAKRKIEDWVESLIGKGTMGR